MRTKAADLKVGDRFVSYETLFEVSAIEWDYRARRNKIRIKSVSGKNHAEGRYFAAVNPREWVEKI